MNHASKGEGGVRRPRTSVRFEGSISGEACITVAAVGRPDAVDAAQWIDPTKVAGVEILVDTGATDSCFRADVAEALSLPVIGTKYMRGINSTTLCQIVTDILVLPKNGRSEFKPVPLIVADIDVPVIFGMSEITQGVLVVDGLRGRWSWSLPR